MSRIAKDAGVSKSLLHYHFNSKEALFVEVQLHLLRDLLGRVQRVTATSNPSVSQLHGALDQVMDFCVSELASLRVLLEFHSAAAESPGIAARLTSFNEEVSKLVVEGLNNVLGPSADRLLIPPDRVARLLQTVFHGLILELAYATAGDETNMRVRETFADARTVLLMSLIREVS